MTDPTDPADHAASLDPETLAFPAGCAAYHQHQDTVQALVARGADTSRVNDRGQTALAAAAFRRSPEIVTALLAAGADPDAGSPSARETAVFFELPEMSDLLPPGVG